MYNFGLIGCGKWGRNYMSTINQIPNVELIAVCQRTPILLERGSFYTDYCEMMDKEQLDGIIISTSPFSHPTIINEALKRKIPVLVEKPVALTIKELDFLNQYPNVKLMVDYIHLYAPGFRSMVETLRSQKLIRIETRGIGGAIREYSSLFDYGPHNLAMCMELTGCINPILKNISKKDELFELEMRFDDIPAKIEIGINNTEKAMIFDVSAERCRFGYRYDGNSSNYYYRNKRPIECQQITPLTNLINTFINNQYNTQAIIQQTIAITKILEEVYTRT